MKNVYTSLDINLLADKMMVKIQESWKTPFDSPVVVFTDSKTEQWFKLFWLKKQGTGNSILMNLETKRIQQFLFDLVKPQNSDKNDIKNLSVEMLRDVIITKLTEKTAGKYYFETLGAPEVETYLTTGSTDSKINANHLYDFSQTIASLFLDYEDTRPDMMDEVLAKSPWQAKLYNDVIGESGAKIENVKYMTLFQLAELNKKANAGTLTFNKFSDHPIFIFGFSGLGQSYRNILNEFSKKHTLEVFLQAMDYEENPENQLLDKWAEFGKEQYDLWSKDSTLQKLSEQNFNKTDSLLHRIQKSVAENKKLVQEPFNAADNSLTLTAAPTSLREVEAVHTKICELLSQENTGTRLGDILVLAPNIQDYKTAIEQVFDQTDQFSKDSAFPYIPYTIADYSGERSLTAEALSVLFGILNKGYLSRADVFLLLHNYLVQSVRGLSDKEVSSWADWTSQLNVFRDRVGHDDWKKAKTRILLSRLTNETVIYSNNTDNSQTNDRQFLPFESIDSQDNDSLYRFVQTIDELLEWTKYSKKTQFTKEDIDNLQDLLDCWLHTGDNTPDDLNNESLVYQNVTEEIERQKLTDSQTVYSRCFQNALLDRSRAVSLSSSNILSTGITFANFESNHILSAKYVFLMGLDSKAFPGLNNNNELDMRINLQNPDKREPGDESVPLKNKNAFLCQLMSASEGLFISYINKDLQKDEDFYKSSVLATLFDTVYAPVKDKKAPPAYEKQIHIDEDRDWNELYTLREFRNKKNFEKLKETGRTPPREENYADNYDENDEYKYENNINLPDRVSISSITKFLQDPFIFQAEQLFNKDDDISEEEQQEYEPLTLNRLTESSLRKKEIKKLLPKLNSFPIFDVNEPIDISSELSITELTQKLQNLNLLPDSFFGTTAVDSFFSSIEGICKTIRFELPGSIEEICNTLRFELPEVNFIKDNVSQLVKKDIVNNKKDWFITGEMTWHNKIEDFKKTNTLLTLDFNNSENYLPGYITSLVLLADLHDDDSKFYNIILNVIDSNAKLSNKTYFATPKQAKELLNQLYKKMFIKPYGRCIPFSIMKKDIEKNNLTFSSLKYELNGEHHPEWGYFSKKTLFDMDKHLGYSTDPLNFSAQWKMARDNQRKLILYLPQAEENDTQNETGEQ